MSYKRVLLKISGEQFGGGREKGIDAERGAWFADEVKKVVDSGISVAIMIGGGNLARGTQWEGNGIKRVTADQIGMLATFMNALALNDIFEFKGLESRCMSSIFAEQLAEPLVHRKAEKHLAKNRVVIVAGGIGRPYVTTDTAAVCLALELGCDVVLKATKVDGVFDSDPEKNPDAVKLEELSSNDAVNNPAIRVMDKAALGLALENSLPIVVFDVLKPDNILLAARGESVGTVIRP